MVEKNAIIHGRASYQGCLHDENASSRRPAPIFGPTATNLAAHEVAGHMHPGSMMMGSLTRPER
jgi:hypothetical protein